MTESNLNTFYTFCGYFLKNVIIRLGLWGLALMYYLCYSFWCLVALVMKTMMNQSGDKKSQEIWRERLNKLPFPHPDVFKGSLDLIASKGNNFQVHFIKTEDNYLLKAWRLHKDPNQLIHKYPIMLTHGLLDCSWSWFLNNDSKQTLPYILSDLGYDVWVMNNRGNKYSMGHTDIIDCKNSKKYWDFSFDEIAKYDVEANVNYVKRASGKDKVIYIGHSQGSTQMFAKVCLDPKFQEHLQCFIAFGPSIGSFNLVQYYSYIIKESNFVKQIIKSRFIDMLYCIKHPSFLQFDDATHVQIGSLCYLFNGLFQSSLYLIVNLLCGYPEKNKIDLDRFGVMVTHEPGGSSVKALLQWMQFIRNKKFGMFDYGTVDNIKHYGQPSPPQYDLSQLSQFTVPKYLFVGLKDILCSEVDIAHLVTLLNRDKLEIYHLKDYVHLDYLWAQDAHLTMYGQVIAIIKENQI